MADYLGSQGVEEGDASLAPDFYLQEELLAGREKALSLKVIHTPALPGVCFTCPSRGPGIRFQEQHRPARPPGGSLKS